MCDMLRAWSHGRSLGSLGFLGELSKCQGLMSLTKVEDIAASLGVEKEESYFKCVDSEDP